MVKKRFFCEICIFMTNQLYASLKKDRLSVLKD